MKKLLFLILLLAPCVCRAQPKYNGFSFPTWWRDSYESADAAASLKQMAEAGADSVAIIPTWYMDDSKSSSMAAKDGTASDASLQKIMQAARGLKMQVILKPHVDISAGGARAWIEPKDPEAWFKSYREFILHYARMARDEKADMFVVGTELTTMSRSAYTAKWEGLIKEIKAIYGGPLTYASNWYDYKDVEFWKSLDFIGIDGYFSMNKGPSLAQLKEGWQEHIPGLKAAAAKYGKSILFTEMGIPCKKGAEKEPWNYLIKGDVDVQLQSDYFQAFLDVFSKESYYAGFLQWNWELDPKAGGPKDGSMTVQNKPALDVLKAYFKSLKAPASQPATPKKSAMKLPEDRIDAVLRTTSFDHQ